MIFNKGGIDQKTWDIQLASETAFKHDLNRALKQGRPFMLMESTPSVSNWAPVNKLKRSGFHLLVSLQAVAHGSDTVQYFQWRKSRGSCEKFHGAVVDHAGHENTKIFRDVAQVGNALKKLDPVIGTSVPAETAVILDWENRWALEDAQGPRNDEYNLHDETCVNHYRSLWKLGVPVDVIDMGQSYNKYKLLIAPMLYMLKPGVAKRMENFVKKGGTLVVTYLSGIVNESDLCFLGGFPGPLRKVLGIWSEEIDALYPEDSNAIVMKKDVMGLSGEYRTKIFCDLIHAESAKVLAEYKSDYYAGRPALTVNKFGRGNAYYIASRNEPRFLDDLYAGLVKKTKLKRALKTDLPEGVSAMVRTDGKRDFIFVMNFTQSRQKVDLGKRAYSDLLTGKSKSGSCQLDAYGIWILSE
jgi:beta-galactosidase